MNNKIIISILLSTLCISAFSASVFAEEFQINKGWNLVSFYIIDEYYDDNLLDSKTVYFFDLINKNYVDYGAIDKGLYSSMDSYYGDFDIYSAFTPVWFYSKKDVLVSTVKFNSKTKENGNTMFKMTRGWNLINIHETITDKDFESFSGSCDLEKIYFFNPEKQDWIEVPLEDDFDRKMKGWGAAIKVTDDCELDFTEMNSNPPLLPN